jgi:CHASE2 domain-containing sensor protein
MTREGHQGGSSAGRERGVLGHIYRHCANEWPSALLCASLVTIAHLQFNWLKTFEAYTFIAIGQLSSIAAAVHPESQPRAAVVVIDPATFEGGEFQEKTPLNRCAIAGHLRAIYAAGPDIVAVDLDISPERPLKGGHAEGGDNEVGTDDYAPCERLLYDLIQCKAYGGSEEAHAACAYEGVECGPACSTSAHTVLLDPFPAQDPRLNEFREAFRKRMKERGESRIHFANGYLPVSYGVHVNASTDGNAIPVVVARVAGAPDTHASVRTLDTRQFLQGLKLYPTGEFSVGEGCCFDEQGQRKPQLAATLREGLAAEIRPNNPTAKSVVFYGAGFGAGDVVLTPIGEIYGVEAHAAAYVSDVIDLPNHVLAFFLDFLIALAMSLFIAFFWRKYFDARLSDRRARREAARLWILALVLSVLAAGFGLSVLSFIVLTTLGVWLSPVPIVIGMLIDSFVSGSVDQGTHKFVEMRRDLLRHYAPLEAQRRETEAIANTLLASREGSPGLASGTLDVALAASSATVQSGDDVLVLESTVVRVTEAPPPSRFVSWGMRRLPRALGGELCELIARRDFIAAHLVGLWLFLWLAAAIFAFALAWSPPH